LRLLGGGLLGRVPHGKQRKGIHIPVRLRSQANPEVKVRLGAFGIAARADRSHDFSFADRGPDPNADRPQVDERYRVPARGANRQALPFVRQLPREGDEAGRGSPDIGARRSADVDAPVLTARVRIVIRHERAQHGTVDRPRPRGRLRDVRERDEQDDGREEHSVANSENHAVRVPNRLGCCQICLQRGSVEPISRESR